MGWVFVLSSLSYWPFVFVLKEIKIRGWRLGAGEDLEEVREVEKIHCMIVFSSETGFSLCRLASNSDIHLPLPPETKDACVPPMPSLKKLF